MKEKLRIKSRGFLTLEQYENVMTELNRLFWRKRKIEKLTIEIESKKREIKQLETEIFNVAEYLDKYYNIKIWVKEINEK